MNDYKQELVRPDRKYHLNKLFQCHLRSILLQSLRLALPRFPNNKFKLLTVTNETRKYFIHSNCHLDSLSQYKV